MQVYQYKLHFQQKFGVVHVAPKKISSWFFYIAKEAEGGAIMGQKIFKSGHEHHDSGNKDTRYIQQRLEAIKKPFEVVDPLIPNGIFPPEILELILMHLDPPSLARVVCSCKLWLQTSDRVFKYTYQHRYLLPHNVDLSNFNGRDEVLKQHLIEQQMAKGHCWPQVLIQDYDSNRSRTSFQHKWSYHGNVIALTKEKVHHSSYGSSTGFKQTTLLDLGGSGVEQDTVYGTQFVGGVRVVPKPTQFFDWNWEEVSCYNVENAEPMVITRKNKFIRDDTGDPWHTLRAPKRFMQGFANLDGTPQLLIYDMNTTYGRTGLDTFMIEVWDVTNGELVHEIKLSNVGDNVVGLYKNYVIMTLSETDETVFVNLKSGLVEKSFPHSSNKHSFHLFDGKFAFVRESEVTLYDLNSGDLIKRIKIDLFKTDGSFMFTGVSFDKWKLVVSTKVLEVKANYSSMHGGFIAVFDMTNEFKLLCTKYVAHFSKDWVQMACLPNGSIVVSDSSLLLFDFIHPYLEKPIGVAVLKTGATSVKVAKINPLDLSTFATKSLNAEFGALHTVTYYEVEASEAPRPTTNRYYSNDERYTHLTQKSMRITFITVRTYTASSYGKQTKSFEAPFLKYWRKHTDTVAPFVLASNSEEKPHRATSYRSNPFRSDSIMVFEKFNEKTQRWEITNPFVPQGINVDIEFDV